MNLQTRVVNILTKPGTEWPIIAAEHADVASLYANYILLVAAIPAACLFLGLLLMSGAPGVALVTSVMEYVSWLASLYVAALVIDKLAPNFDSHGGTAQALKLVAYASTPVWVAGILYLVPPLGGLVILAVFYGFYLFYLGLPSVMKTPSDKVLPYMIVSALALIVVSVCIRAVLSAMSGAAATGGAVFGGRVF